MASDVALLLSLDARLNRFETQLKKAGAIGERTAKEIEGKFARINPQMGFLSSFSKQFLASAAGALGLQQAIMGVRNAVRQVDEIGDLAERIGVSTDTIQTLKFTLAQMGGSAEIADRALDKFADTMGEAQLGGGYMAKVMEANNISFKKFNGEAKTTEELLVDVARLAAGIQDPMLRLKFVVDNFGRQAGPQFVTTLLRIANEGFPALTDQAKRAGAVLGDDVFAQADKLEKKFVEVETRISNTYKQFMIEWGGPAILTALEGIRLAFVNIAVAADLLKQGRLREALALPGTLSQVEQAQQRMKMGGGIPLGAGDGGWNFFPTGTGGQIGPQLPPGWKPNTTVLPPTGSSTGSKESIDAFERAIAAAKEHTEVTIAETAAIDDGAAAVTRAKLVVELRTAAMEANTKAGMAANTVTAEQETRLQAVADATYNAAKAMEAAKGPLKDFAREARDMNKSLQQGAVDSLRHMEDALVDLVTGTATVQEAFKKMTEAILSDLARLAIRMMITGPIAGMLGNMFMPGAAGVPLRAGGGPVSAGRPYVVGENGPELLVPATSGMIIPNGVAGGRGGGFHLQIINNGAKVETSEPKRNSDGSMSLTVMVDRMVAKNGSTPGTATNKMLRSQGGKQPLSRRV